MIKLQNVSKSYFLGEEEVKAVRNATLEIKDKEYVSILGTSGSGKSTLMYLIGLLEQPTSGKILLDNKDVSKLSDIELSHIFRRGQLKGITLRRSDKCSEPHSKIFHKVITNPEEFIWGQYGILPSLNSQIFWRNWKSLRLKWVQFNLFHLFDFWSIQMSCSRDQTEYD